MKQKKEGVYFTKKEISETLPNMIDSSLETRTQ